MLAPCLSLKALLSPLGTITNLAPRCLVWVSGGIVIPCQSFWGIVRRSRCFEAGRDVPQSPRIWPVLFLPSARAIFKHHKSIGKKVLILSLQGLLLPGLPPVQRWLLCSGSPSGAKFICFSFSDSHSLIFILGPHNHLISPCFLFPFPEREIGWTVVMEMLFRDSVQSSDVCSLVLPSIPSCYTRASTGYLSAYYL